MHPTPTHPPSQPASQPGPRHSPSSGAPSPSSFTSSRSHLPRWSSMPPHFHLAAYSPALAPALSLSATTQRLKLP
uniref:Uncharacterized protein n=1 Tax=Mesocestoides corti TaxID=53468 RepID=A0A5K3G6E5_MESCO